MIIVHACIMITVHACMLIVTVHASLFCMSVMVGLNMCYWTSCSSPIGESSKTFTAKFILRWVTPPRHRKIRWHGHGALDDGGRTNLARDDIISGVDQGRVNHLVVLHGTHPYIPISIASPSPFFGGKPMEALMLRINLSGALRFNMYLHIPYNFYVWFPCLYMLCICYMTFTLLYMCFLIC